MEGTPTAPTVLRVEGLTIALPAGGQRAFAVEDVSFSVSRGRTLCMVGESGSGKSVTAQAILGLLPPGRLRPVAGRIQLGEENLLSASRSRLRRLRGAEIGMIFQEPMTALNPIVTIGHHVSEALGAHGVPRTDRRPRLLQLFQDVKMPDPERIARRYPHQVSGGQRQRAMIAGAVALRPSLLIADEPTTALDVTTQSRILRLLRDLQAANGTAILLITHDFGVVADVADDVIVMRDGRIVEAGPAADVLAAPKAAYTRALLDAVPPVAPKPRPPSRLGAPLLRAEDLVKLYAQRRTFGQSEGNRALAEVSLTIHEGEALVLVGESGSGKSTLARCLMQLEPVDEGRLFVGDEEVTGIGPRALRHNRGVAQIVFQDPYGSLNPRRRIGLSVAEGPLIQGLGRPAAFDVARAMLEAVGLDPGMFDRFPHQFSGGQRQRICIARALAIRPRVLIADEPVSALDVSIQAQILDLLERLRAQWGLAMLFITHDLRVAAKIADRVAVMRAGQIVEVGPVADIFQRPSHPYTRDLLTAMPGRARVSA